MLKRLPRMTEKALGYAGPLFSVGLLVLAAACGPSGPGDGERGLGDVPPDESSAPLLVYTVNYPLAYFAERIGGELVDVRFPAPPNVDPALWSPDAETVATYQQADLILLNGAAYAGWVDRASLPSSRMVTTTDGVRDRFVVVEDALTHSHGPEGEHAHGEIASITWLDAGVAVEQARAILTAFAGARPDSVDGFDSRFRALERDLIDIDQQIAPLVAADPDRPLLASHPVYQYLAARYGMNLRSLHFEPDEPPGATGWRELRSLLDEHPAGWMLWEAEPLPETAAQLREIGVESVVFDPAGNRPAVGDYLSVMRENARSLQTAFADTAGG